MNEGPPPYVVAGIDQDKAELANLVRKSREHAKVCGAPATVVCPSLVIFNYIMSMRPETAKRLLVIAITLSGKDEPLCQTDP